MTDISIKTPTRLSIQYNFLSSLLILTNNLTFFKRINFKKDSVFLSQQQIDEYLQPKTLYRYNIHQQSEETKS